VYRDGGSCLIAIYIYNIMYLSKGRANLWEDVSLHFVFGQHGTTVYVGMVVVVW